jgi:hypothetical protein
LNDGGGVYESRRPFQPPESHATPLIKRSFAERLFDAVERPLAAPVSAACASEVASGWLKINSNLPAIFSDILEQIVMFPK